MMDTGFAYCGIFIATYEIMIAGATIANNTPAIIGSVEIVVIVKPNAPKDNAIPKTTRVVAFALLLVETPPSKMPVAKKIKPINMVSPVSACIPSMNVFAIPAYDMIKPASPIPVSPIPGIIRSQLLNWSSWKN